MVDIFSGTLTDGFFAPQRFEGEIEDCEKTGTIPADMDGMFVRVGGEFFYPPKFPNDAPLHSDGYISAFRFKNGRVSYKGRFIRTPRFEANLEAGRNQFGLYRNPFTHDEAVRGLNATVSNTAPMAHAGKLFTLKEDALPIEIDPLTLETKGFHDFNGGWKSETFTAHPKWDPLTGDMYAFGYEATGLASDDIYFYRVDPQGNVAHEIRIKQQPYVCLIHDFAVTQEHVIFPFACYYTDMEQLRAGKIHWMWDKTLPSMIGIMRRDGDGSDLRWFRGPERCMMHVFNAQTDGNTVTLLAPFYNGNFFPFFPNVDGSPWDPSKAQGFVRKYTFDLSSSHDGWTEETLFPAPIVDLGKVDHRFTTLPQRYAYSTMADQSRPFDTARAGEVGRKPVNSYARFDLAEGKMDTFFPGDTHSLQEVSFVPRRGSSEEGDGYLIGTASNLADMRTELVIVDAQRLEEVGRVFLPFRAATQVHGYWYDAEQLNLNEREGNA